MSKHAVFFDLDGTLLDTSRDLGAALNQTLRDHDRSVLPDEHIRPHVSNGANALLKLGFNCEPGAPQHASLRETLLSHYRENIAVYTQPFLGINELLQHCMKQNILWGVVTNKPWPLTEPLMQALEWPIAPSTLVCPDHVRQAKPAPDALLLACEQAQVSVSNAIYIGDHLRDIECGRNANMTTIAVGYGFTQTTSEHRNWGADYCVDHASEIWPIVTSHFAINL